MVENVGTDFSSKLCLGTGCAITRKWYVAPIAVTIKREPYSGANRTDGVHVRQGNSQSVQIIEGRTTGKLNLVIDSTQHSSVNQSETRVIRYSGKERHNKHKHKFCSLNNYL